MTSWARFWAVDFHVHTPGSQDAMDENFGAPGDIVAAAIAAKPDAIVITDHNTVSWCKDVADRAGRLQAQTDSTARFTEKDGNTPKTARYLAKTVRYIGTEHKRPGVDSSGAVRSD